MDVIYVKRGKYMRTNFLLVVLVMFFFLSVFTTATASTGFGPAEMYTSNQRDTLVVGNATLINGEDTPRYGVFSIVMPYSDKDTYQVVASEIIHARVLCNKCGESMQRWEAIPGYEYGDPLVGTCTKCGSSDLTFYTPMPRDEYESLSVKSAGNFHLEKVGHHTWKTKELISPMGACNINVLYDASSSYIQSNIDGKWEVHLRGKTVAEIGEGFMVGGIDLRVLINFKLPLHIKILDTIVKGETFRVQITYGPPDKSWEMIPDEPITVDFNGVKQTTDEDGIVVFTFPDTRLDYEYKITAIGTDTYLLDTNMVTTGIDAGGSDDIVSWIVNNIFVVIVILLIICVCIVFALRYYFVWG